MVITHPAGEQTYYAYEFKWTSDAVETHYTLIARLLQGTGKFKGVRGIWNERGRLTMSTDDGDWVVDYETR